MNLRWSTFAVLLLLSGCSRTLDPDVYPLAMADAYERLQAADTNGFRAAQHCGIDISLIADASGGQQVRWGVFSSNKEVANFTIHLEPVSATSTRVAIEIPADPAGGEIYDGEKHYDRPAFQQPLRPALHELVDAAMAQRGFDPNRLADPHGTDAMCGMQRAAVDAGTGHYTINDVVRFGSDGKRRLGPNFSGPQVAAIDFGNPSSSDPSAQFGQPGGANPTVNPGGSEMGNPAAGGTNNGPSPPPGGHSGNYPGALTN